MDISSRKISKQVETYTRILNSDISKLDEFAYSLEDVLENNSPNACTERASAINENIILLKSLEEVQKNYGHIKICIDNTFGSLKIECNDMLKNKHFLIVDFDKRNKFKITKHSLPDVTDLSSHYNDINSVVIKFLNCLNTLGEYFDVISEIDEYCWVIDPENPTFKDNYRRIMIVAVRLSIRYNGGFVNTRHSVRAYSIADADVSALINVGIYCAKGPPGIKLLGPSKFTDPLIEKIHKNIIEWDPSSNSFIDNMLHVFGLTKFLQGKNTIFKNNSQTEETECSICFSGRDELGSPPSIQCEQTLCRQNFHSSCLYQWLSAVTNNVQRFNTIHGECPSCSTKIVCPTVEL